MLAKQSVHGSAGVKQTLNIGLRIAISLAWCEVVLLTPYVAGQEPAPSRGAEIWQNQCVACHGSAGTGVSGKYEHQLTGPATLEELASLIEQTMPEDDPEACVGADAWSVAEFLRAEIFPRLNAPPADSRRDLLHLTISQYENAVALLGQTFLEPKPIGTERGLSAKYFNSREFDPQKRVHERIEPGIDLQLGNAGPLGDQTSQEEFSIVWSGSVFIAETGTYEFVVQSPNGYRLFVNRTDEPLLDNWVSTQAEPEKRAPIRLWGGRWYPLRLQATKVKDPDFYVRLLWRRPRRLLSPLPRDVLAPDPASPVLVFQTTFPPDDSSRGYARGALFSAEWEQATTEAALEIADTIGEHLPAFVGARPNEAEFGGRCQDFLRQFSETAFGRPLTAAERELYIERFFSERSEREALSLALLAILKSPWFLYVNPPGGMDSEADGVARNLARTIHDGLPTHELRKAVRDQLEANPQNESAAGLRALARTELSRPLAAAKWRQFFVEWLKLEDVEELQKDRSLFEQFDPQLVDDLHDSLLRFWDQIWCDPACDFRELFLADYLWMNSRLRQVYGPRPDPGRTSEPQRDGGPDPAPAHLDSNDLTLVRLDPSDRAGLLTHPLVLSQLAYFRHSSPIHRGVFVTRHVLGLPLPPPPVAVEPLAADSAEHLTTRQRVELQTQPANCMSCHQRINPFGFALEGFDAIGRSRLTEGDQPIDALVQIQFDGEPVTSLTGPRALAEFLVRRRETHRHFVRSVFQHAVQHSPTAYSPELLDELTDFFIEHHFHLRELIAEIAVRTATWQNDRMNSPVGQQTGDEPTHDATTAIRPTVSVPAGGKVP